MLIDLKNQFPKQIIYRSLDLDGFSYDGINGPAIVMYGKGKSLRILNNSILHANNNPDTVKLVIKIVDRMDRILF